MSYKNGPPRDSAPLLQRRVAPVSPVGHVWPPHLPARHRPHEGEEAAANDKQDAQQQNPDQGLPAAFWRPGQAQEDEDAECESDGDDDDSCIMMTQSEAEEAEVEEMEEEEDCLGLDLC